MNATSVWPDNEYHQRRDVDRRMEEQEGESFAKIVAGTTEEDLGHELDGLTSDGDVIEQRHRIRLGAVRIF